jgi:glc operon protein GlcG
VRPKSGEDEMNRLIESLALAAAGALALGGVAFGQNVPAQFVVSGKAAEKIQDFTTINLATAEHLAESCEKAVTAKGGGVHTIMVLDNDGNRVYMDRMDGQAYINIVTAEMKARTALMTREPSKVYANRTAQDPTQEFQEIQLGYYPVSGALPIIVNKQMIGVIGIGGFPPNPPVWSDEICAHTALVEVIGPSVAPLMEDLPRRPNVPNPNAVPVPRFVTATPPKATLAPEFVVGSKAAGSVFDGNQISLAAAKKVARACRDWAASKGSTMSLYIIDDAGEFVHIERMDGQVSSDNRTALLKAQTALKTRQPTSMSAAQVKNNPGGLPRTTMFFNYFADPGGIPIVVDGQMIGAIGVSGVGNDDENCAIEGLKAAFGEHVTLPVYTAAPAGGRGGRGG